MKNSEVCNKCGKNLKNKLKIKICPDCEPDKYKKEKRKVILIIVAVIFFVIGIIGSFDSNSKTLSDMITEKDVYNGSNNKVVGKMGYIEIEKDKFDDIFENNNKEYSELMEKIVEKKYNWFIIYFGNNKGLYCNTTICFECNIKTDENGLYIYDGNDVGTIVKKDGTYVYEKVE